MGDLLMAKQTGSEYREKNRIRLQRFYERQAASGKKRVSAQVSDEAYRLLTNQKEQSGESMSTLIDQAVMVAYGQQGIPDIMSDEAYALLMDAKEHTGDSLPMLIDRAVMAAYGTQDILDVDDTAWSEPDPEETPSADPQDIKDIELDISLVDPEQDQAGDTQDPDQGKKTDVDTVTDDTALVDQEATPDQVDHTSVAKADDPGDQIPDCTGKTITREERDKILVQVMELLPGRSNAQDRVTLLNEKAVPLSLKPGQYGGEWDRKKFTDNLRFAKKRLGIK
jgi:hypothetical protein